MYGNIDKFYKYSGECDDQQQYKAIPGLEMVSTPEGFTNNSTISHSQYVIVKILMQENHSVTFCKHLTPNLRL